MLLLLQLRMCFFADDYGRKLRKLQIPQVQNVENVVTVAGVRVTFGKISTIDFGNAKDRFCAEFAKAGWGLAAPSPTVQ